MKRLLVLMIIVPVVAFAVTSPPPTHIRAEDTSAGSTPDVPATREWTIVRVDTMTSYIRYLFEHQQALVLPMGDMYYLYWAHNDNNSHVRTIVFGETQFADPASWVVQDIYAGTIGYVSPSAYWDGSIWYPEATFNTDGLTAHMVDEGGPGIWSNPCYPAGAYNYYPPLTWAGSENVIYMSGQARDVFGDSHFFMAFDGWTCEVLFESMIFP